MSLKHSEAKAHFISTYDFDMSHQVVHSFLGSRALMTQNSFERMTVELIPGEIDEGELEANKRGSAEYDPKAEHTEAFDISFFVSSLAYALRINLDRTKAMSYINGQGKKSSLFDGMKEKSGNLSKKSLDRDLHYMLGDLYSYYVSQPVTFDGDKTMQIVLEKNSRNYPQTIFEARDHLTGTSIIEEEREVAFVHRKTAINFIRRTLRDKMGHTDRAYGLRQEDYLPYLPFILDYRNSQTALENLKKQFSRDHGITL